MVRRGFLEPGDPIWFRPKSNRYGKVGDIPGLFVRRSARRTVIRLILDPQPAVQVAVDPLRVRARDLE